MCIRDRVRGHRQGDRRDQGQGGRLARARGRPGARARDHGGCLLYTSDAAAERSSVDLGGRRIIKKKTTWQFQGTKTTMTRTTIYDMT